MAAPRTIMPEPGRSIAMGACGADGYTTVIACKIAPRAEVGTPPNSGRSGWPPKRRDRTGLAGNLLVLARQRQGWRHDSLNLAVRDVVDQSTQCNPSGTARACL